MNLPMTRDPALTPRTGRTVSVDDAVVRRAPPPMQAHGTAALAALAAVALSVTLAADLPQQAVFRAGIDLLVIDVAVVDSDGHPIRDLGPSAFDVSVDGKERKVVSVEFVSREDATLVRPDQVGSGPGPGHTFVIALDDGSFVPGTGQGPAAAVREFLNGIDTAERVGLYVMPGTSWIPPTTERVPLRMQLGGLTGQRPATENPYNLKIFEVVDITTQAGSGSSISQVRSQGRAQTPRVFDDLDVLQRVWNRECPTDPDCAMRIYTAGLELAARLERQAQATIGGLDGLLQQLGRTPERKTVVLVTAGLVASDRPGGRPDLGNVMNRLSQMAAAARAVVYTVHIDPSSSASAAGGGRDLIQGSSGRDRLLLGAWLDTLSSAAGGSRIFVGASGSEGALQRVLRESAGHYVVAIEPQPSDLDKRPRRLEVTVNSRNAHVRSPAWLVAVPPPGP
jgi:VWFA-related protein